MDDASFQVYADGRVLSIGTHVRVPHVTGGGAPAEQRLTPEGVEFVRSAFLSTGLFDTGQTNPDVFAWCGCSARVRDDSGRLVVPDQSVPWSAHAIDPRITGEVDRMVELITHLESSLPETAWADRTVRLFVPSHYLFSLGTGTIINGTAYPDPDPVPNRSKVLAAVLPARLVRHLDEQGWQPSPFGDYVVVTTADARAIHQAFTKAGIPFTINYAGPGTGGASTIYSPFKGATSRDPARRERAAIRIGLNQLPPAGCCDTP